VSYSKAQTCRILRKIGYSPKKPVKRSKKYSQQAVEHWLRYKWPHIKKSRDNGWYIVFIDESGYSLVPFLLRSWSPIGVPDIIRESEKRAHLSSIGLVSISPIRHNRKLFTTTFPGSAKSAEMSYVLDALHEHLPGTIIILWDNWKGHFGLQAKYERQHPDWFHCERLPTYSPELNVVEQGWNQIKNVEMANFAPKNQKQVIAQVELATQEINKNKRLLPNFLKHIKLKR